MFLIASNLLHVNFFFSHFWTSKRILSFFELAVGIYKYMTCFLAIHKEQAKQAWEPFFITIWLLFKTLVKNLVQSTQSQSGVQIQSLDSKYTHRRNYHKKFQPKSNKGWWDSKIKWHCHTCSTHMKKRNSMKNFLNLTASKAGSDLFQHQNLCQARWRSNNVKKMWGRPVAPPETGNLGPCW